MLRKIVAAVLFVVALAAVSAAVPGLAENIAFGCVIDVDC